MDASFALVAKNADDPGRMVADRVVRTARDAGFEGKASVWFYETPEASASSTERHWVVGMQFEEESPTVFARGYGIEGLPVASYRVLTAMPYAGERCGGRKRGAADDTTTRRERLRTHGRTRR